MRVLKHLSFYLYNLFQNVDEPDSINVKVVNTSVSPNTQRARNRLQELKAWLDKEKAAAATDQEGASWWIVALCVLCFLIVVVLIVLYSPASSGASSVPPSSSYTGDTTI